MDVYGLTLRSPSGASIDPNSDGGHCSVPTVRPWRPITVVQMVASAPTYTTSAFGPDDARLDVAHRCRLDMTREPLRATISAPHTVSVDSIRHPLGAYIGAAAARWHGRTALHAAALLVDGGAVVLLGAAEAGKSTLVTSMARRGHQVISDDLVVIEDGLVLAGPAYADLRADAGAQLGSGQAVPDSIGRERLRVSFPPPPLESELSALCTLRWGDALSIRRSTVVERLRDLAVNEALGQGPSRPDSFLDLLNTPSFQFQRPRSWSAIGEVAKALEDLVTANPNPRHR